MSLDKIDPARIKAAVTDIVGQLAEFCFLLGSAGTPRFRPESDIDLAIFWKGEEPDFNHRQKFMQELEDRLGHEIDLISLNNIDVIYGIQVVDTGRLLINNNAGLLLDWKSRQLSRYPDFKASRAIIEKNILNRKKYV